MTYDEMQALIDYHTDLKVEIDDKIEAIINRAGYENLTDHDRADIDRLAGQYADSVSRVMELEDTKRKYEGEAH